MPGKKEEKKKKKKKEEDGGKRKRTKKREGEAGAEGSECERRQGGGHGRAYRGGRHPRRRVRWRGRRSCISCKNCWVLANHRRAA